MTFTEVADRVWVARYDWFDVNVTLVGGADGLLVVDTHASAEHAREVDLLGRVDLKEIYDLSLLNEVLAAANHPEVKS